MANSLNTITVDGVTYDAEQYAKDHAKVSPNDELGKDVFLQLLVAQMKYQDPLNPQDNSQYIAELANFSALEQMTNVNTNLESLSTIVGNLDTSVLVGQLSSMIGKRITWETKVEVPGEDGQTTNQVVAGNVKGITMTNGTPMVIAEIDGENYKVEIANITNIYDPSIGDQNVMSDTTTSTTNLDTSTTTTATTIDDVDENLVNESAEDSNVNETTTEESETNSNEGSSEESENTSTEESIDE